MPALQQQWKVSSSHFVRGLLHGTTLNHVFFSCIAIKTTHTNITALAVVLQMNFDKDLDSIYMLD